MPPYAECLAVSQPFRPIHPWALHVSARAGFGQTSLQVTDDR